MVTSLDFRPVTLVTGWLLLVLSAGMVLPMVVDAYLDNPDWQVFGVACGLGLFFGSALVLTSRGGPMSLNLRQAFLLTNVVWVVLPVFAALPLWLSGLTYTDAFFEAMSGITTTGATVMVGLDTTPPGILLWRAVLQWLGGLGIIIMALTILPMLRVGGMQMFRVEAFEAQEKILPRATQLAGALLGLYIALTLGTALLLWLAGMSGFDALAHAMTTIATGGYSTRDASVGAFDNAWIDVIITLGMVTGGIPFLLLLQAARGKGGQLLSDTQVHWYLGTIVVSVLSVAIWLWLMDDFQPLQALRYSAFNVTSVMTGTGYATADFNAWNGFPIAVLFCLMFVGGCAGSTTCAIKIFRFQILYETARVQIRRLLQPHGVFIPYFNHRPVQAGVPEAVMGFFFLYLLSCAFLTMALGLMGLDLVTALSGAVTAISNVGPGLGSTIGPAGNFAPLPDAAKWLLAFGMMLGRLELYSVLVLLLPRFWRD